ncbi:MAG: hypothetical protein JOZ47_22670 [Kutzneria sp.]|nr:hypothetical protein [Kutzneria sp.]MBV9847847.1 hypothetical protein [Kutzneria sp.]
MSGFIHWYEGDWSTWRAGRTVARIESLGLNLSEQIGLPEETVLSEQDAQRHALLTRLALTRTRTVDVAYRLDDRTALHCRFRRVDEDIVVQEFDLDGLSTIERNQLVRGIIELFGDDPASTVGFVADRSGRSEDVDWDDVVLGHPRIITVRPDMLALPTPLVDQLHPELYLLVGSRLGALTVYDRTNLLAEV